MLIKSIQIAPARKVQIGGRSILTAIHKSAVIGAVPVGVLGLMGDEQADLSIHGGLEKAVYAYPSEHYGFWHSQRKHAVATDLAGMSDQLPYGSLGENLTLCGLLESGAWVGDVLQFAHCTLRITQPRDPCFKFNAAMGYSAASKNMALSGFCGFYLAVDEPGSLQAGESFKLLPGPRRMGITERFKARMFKHLR